MKCKTQRYISLIQKSTATHKKTINDKYCFQNVCNSKKNKTAKRFKDETKRTPILIYSSDMQHVHHRRASKAS